MKKKARKPGRPLRYPEPKLMQARIDDYWKLCEKKGEPCTVSGLAVHLDMTRTMLGQYAERSEFQDIIKKARARIEADYEKRLVMGIGSTAGVIFCLKNHFNWSDRHEVDVQDTTPVSPCELPPSMARLIEEVCGPQRSSPPLRVYARAEPEPLRTLPVPDKPVVDAEIVREDTTEATPKFRPVETDPETERLNMVQYREAEERSQRRYEQRGYDSWWEGLEDADGNESRPLPAFRPLSKS